MMMLWRWAVGPLGRPWTIRFRSISLKVLVRLSSNITHNTPRGSSCAYWGIWTLTYFWFRTMTYLDVLTRTSFPEQISKSTGPIIIIIIIKTLFTEGIDKNIHVYIQIVHKIGIFIYIYQTHWAKLICRGALIYQQKHVYVYTHA